MTTPVSPAGRSGGATAGSAAAGGRTVAVSVNGAVREVPADATLEKIVATMTSASAGVAAAVNETVVPRGQWSGLRLADGDRVEVLTAVQGG